MATVRELRAIFTAQAQGIKNVAKSVRTELQGIGDSSEKSVKKANASFKDLDQSLNKLDKQLQQSGNAEGFKDLNKAIREARTELVNTGKVSEKSMGELQSAVVDAKKHLSDLGEDGKESLKGFEKTINQVDDQLKQFGKGSGLEQLNGDLKEAGQNSGDLGKKLSDTGSPKIAGGIGGIAKGIGGIATVAIGAITAVAGLVTGLASLVMQGDQLQKTLNKLEQQTGSSKEEMQGMEESLRNIYKSGYGESFDDIADAMANVRQVTGLAGDELESATQQALLLRDSMGFEVNESMKAASVMMKQFGISADEAFTLFAQGQQAGLNYSDDMLDSFWEYSVYFKQLGFDAEGMWNVFQAGAESGSFNIDKVGDAIKELGIRVKDGSDTSIEAFESLGFNADDMAEKFAKGGDGAQEALASVFEALGKIEDPIKRNTIGVNLFGTQFEDLEHETIVALGNVRNEADMTADTLEKMDKLQFNSIGDAFKGMGRIIQTEFLMPIQDKLMPYLNKAANYLKENLPVAIEATKNALRPLGDAFSAIKTILDPLFDIMKTSFQSFIDSMGPAWESLKNLFNSLLPILQAVGAVVGGVLVTALGIAVSAINGVISAIGPVINAFVNFADVVVNVVKAVISVLTGDFSAAMDYWKQATESSIKVFQSLWEGVVNFFKTFVDSIIAFFQNLYMVLVGNSIIPDMVNAIVKWFRDMFTRVIDIVKNIVQGIIQWFTDLLNKALEIFENLKNTIQEKMTAVKNKIEELWNAALTKTIEILGSLLTSAKEKFEDVRSAVAEKMGLVRDKISELWESAKNKTDEWIEKIVTAAKELPGKIGDGIKSMAGKVTDGVKAVANAMAETLGKGINGVIGGVNWVLGKVGVDSKIPEWSVPKYAKGTNKHPGGLAVVGDGRKEELIITPDGNVGLSPAKDTLVNLPKGTMVLSGNDTEKLRKSIVPAYKEGNIGLGDIVSLIASPSKLLDKILDAFGVKVPDFPGMLKDLGKGAFNKIKEAIVGFLKDKLSLFDFGGGSAPNISGGASAWRNMILLAAAQMGETLTESEINGIIAQIQRESGGNQNITQSPAVWDINMANGNPARGLLQYIPGTFRNYMVSGHGNIYNGYDQLLAFFNNTNWRRDLPYGRRGWGPTGARKFAEGGIIREEQFVLAGEGNKEEVIIPLEQFKDRAMSLLMYAADKLGVFKNFNSHNLAGNYHIPAIATMPTSFLTSTTNNSDSNSSDTYYIDKVEIDAKTIKEFEDVSDFFNYLKQTSRKMRR